MQLTVVQRHAEGEGSMLTDKRALVIEDDDHVCEVIRATLEAQHIDVTFSHDGNDGLEEALQGQYDFIILDLMLPGRDGTDVCQDLRRSGFEMPIIMLTAKVEEVDRVLGLELGADDYVTKPFSPRELVARCKAVLRRFSRSEQVNHKEIQCGDLVIRKDQYQVLARGKPMDVTPKEFELLSFMASHPGNTFTRDQLLEGVWGFDSVSETRTVDEHVKRIRRKLKEAEVASCRLKTIWGVGYSFEVLDHA